MNDPTKQRVMDCLRGCRVIGAPGAIPALLAACAQVLDAAAAGPITYGAPCLVALRMALEALDLDFQSLDAEDN